MGYINETPTGRCGAMPSYTRSAAGTSDIRRWLIVAGAFFPILMTNG